MSKTPRTAPQSVDCVAMAREARKCAQAFRASVADFDKINIAGIFGELREMRAVVKA
jgi:hypothetical protein